MKQTMLLLVLLLCLGCSRASEAPPKKAPSPVSVSTAPVVLKDVPLIVEAPGAVEPVRTVTIIARVTGQLEKVVFREGQDVLKGEVLFVLDRAPFVERVKEAESRLAMDKATLAFQKAEARRYERMVDGGAVSQSDIEKTRALALSTEALVGADAAALEKARLDLSYCIIKAPFSGRTGRYFVHEGAMVEANSTELAVINQLSPIHVRFAVPERYLPSIRRFMRRHPLKVSASTAADPNLSHEGLLVFLDNAVDSATGMVFLKAEFENADRSLWPGQYVKAGLMLDVEKDVVTVPKDAVMNGQKGQYLFVVKPANRVESRGVKVDRTVGDEAVVAEGLTAGETVVLSGQDKLQSGFEVRIVPPSGRKPADG